MKVSISKISALVFMLISSAALAQGTLRGVITDSSDKKPLIGANVFLVGTALGSATNLQGEYRIDRIPEGTYTLRIAYIGYLTRNISVNVESNRTLAVNASLTPDIVEGAEIVVTGQAEGQAAAINQQITSNTIINVISEEKIQELPDANAAEAIGRLPGVAIQRSGGEANKIVLRGLSDKYSTVTIDGVRLAPTDADARGVDLSTISQGWLAGIELYKALTPDKDADAIAGSVNMVTKKAPLARSMRLDFRGSYNQLDESYKQYDFAAKFGQRFLNNDVLGVQMTANLVQRNRSKENLNLDYDQLQDSGTRYEITDFTLNYTDEIRNRGGASLLLDVNTPDGGAIRFNNIFNRTKRDFIESERNYPASGIDEVFYRARDREQQINTFTSAITGDNYLLGLSANWGLSLADSKSDFPFDYEIDFTEPSTADAQGNALSGMRRVPDEVKENGPPEALIPYAVNNFARAYLYTSYFRSEENNDNEKTAFLNLAREYPFSNSFSWQLKIGGKYRNRARDRSRSELFSPYYLEPLARYIKTSGGVVAPKDFTGTRFANLAMVGNSILLTNFLDATPANRAVYDKYDLYPLINRDAARLWWELNRNGFSDAAGSNPEYEKNLEPDASYYDITERVYAGYLMNTFNFGQSVTLIAGVRVEHEDNDYASRYSPVTLSGFPVPTGLIRDTSDVHQGTTWLPNFHLNVRPKDFMSVRVAAYKALARPDFNHRLASVVTKARSTFFPGNNIFVGNPGLASAEAWNYEINTSLFSNKLGLFSVSAFYKDVKNMFHMINGLPFSGQGALDSLGIPLQNPFPDVQYVLTYPYNSVQPTRVKGIEIEHQANLRFLPGLFRNTVLSYNLSFVDSETYIPFSVVNVVYDTIPGFPFPVARTVYSVEEQKHKLEGQPEFFGNFAIGYDIGGFSGRLSVFHQSEYNRSFSADGRSDDVVNSFTRWDLAVKQQLSNSISLLLNVNNLTNYEEGTSTFNQVQNWRLTNTGEIYGLTGELGLRMTF